MKVLLINGSPNEKGCTYTALKEIEKTLNQHNIQSEIVYLGKEPIADCIGCFACLKNKKCIYNDKVNVVNQMLDDIQGIILGSPVYFANASGRIRSFSNRLFFSCGSKLRYKLGAAIVSCRRGGASAAFDQLNKYFTINNMPIVSSNYWNQVHGNTPEEVIQDEEGMQTLRILGKSMAWLLNSIEAGKNLGIKEPEFEEKTRTNFIR